LILVILYPLPSVAQIIPDNTLGRESSIVLPRQLLPNEPLTDQIQGGAPRGSNLFHSFLEFNVNTGQQVYFENPEGIDRILTRVTGGNASSIDGTLGVLGPADLFLLNPKGIVFGPNARLDVNGSFFGSTAASLDFQGFEFSATDPSAPPLLTLTVPLGLQYGQTPGLMEATGLGNHATGTPLSLTLIRAQGGLEVKPQKTLALLGGEIRLNGVALRGGQVILMGETGPGAMTLSLDDRGWQVSPQNLTPQPILVTGGSLVNGNRGLTIYGSDLTLRDRSYVVVQVANAPGIGEIHLALSDRLDLSGTSAILTEAMATADGVPLRIEAGTISLREDARIGSITQGSGRSGAVTLMATDSLDLQGQSPLPGLTTQIRSSTFGGGDAGNITVTTPLLTLSNGGSIISTTLLPATGSAGAIEIKAAEVQVMGAGPINFIPSAIRSSSLSPGKAGRVNIESDRVLVTAGGRITALTANGGDAGAVVITASESIRVEGRSANPNPRQGYSRISAAANPLDPITQQSFGLPAVPTGNSGSLTLTAPEIVVQNGGLITTNNEGTGNAGTLSIESDRLRVHNNGEISSTVLTGAGGTIAITTGDLTLEDSTINTSVLNQGAGGNIAITADRILLNHANLSTNTAGTDPGGNIQLTVGELLGLRRGSTIAANATGSEAGGNIQIQTPLLVAVENSDITANATNNRGGTQRIQAQAILGTAVRPALTAFSDITALGAQLSGTITLSTLDFDVSSGLVDLNATPVDPTQQFSAGCNARSLNHFAEIGKGGLPDNPLLVTENPLLLSDTRFDFNQRNHPELPVANWRGSVPLRSLLKEAYRIQDDQGQIHLTGRIPLPIFTRPCLGSSLSH